MPRLRYPHLLLLFFLGLIVYSKTFHSPFVFDDYWYIVENDQIKNLSNFLDLSGTRYVGFLSFALNFAVGAYDVFGYNLVDIAIHIVNSMLVYLFVLLLLRTPTMEKISIDVSYLPLLVSLLFLTHPIETQAVNYVSQRFASLATLFYLSAILFYLSARLSGSIKRDGVSLARYLYYGLAIVLAVIAQKTKEISFTLPFILVLFEFSFFPSTDALWLRARRLLPFLLTLVIIPLSILLPSSTVATGGENYTELVRLIQMDILTENSPYEYLMTQFTVVVSYLRLMVFPVGQNLVYNIKPYQSFFIPEVIASFVFLAAIFFFSIYLWLRSIKRKAALGLLISIGILWFFITVSVESSVVPLRYKMFEHRLYLPSIGFFLAVSLLYLYIADAFSSSRIIGAWKGKRALVLAMLVVLLFSVLSYKRNVIWSDRLLLWEDVVTKNPSAPGYLNYGLALEDSGALDEAMRYYNLALEIDPAHPSGYNNIGVIYMKKGELDLAIKNFRKSLDLYFNEPQVHVNLGNIYKEKRMVNEAIAEYRLALRIDPGFVAARERLAKIYMNRGRVKEAQELLSY